MKTRRSRKLSSVSVRLPDSLIEDLDSLAEECECSRTEIVESILDYVMGKEDLVDEIFPEEEAQSGDESEEEDQEENESED
jgi:predicted transcriptional regulator